MTTSDDPPGVSDALPGDDAARDARAAPGRVDSSSLLRGARELVILHAGREYRLRVTQNGKLILTA